jgi:AbrB family looped-hinge helix DNA binding protein
VLQKGRITIPACIRKRLAINEGDYLRLQVLNNKLTLFPQNTVPNPTKLLSGLAKGVQIKEPLKQELKKAAAVRIHNKASKTGQ